MLPLSQFICISFALHQVTSTASPRDYHTVKQYCQHIMECILSPSPVLQCFMTKYNTRKLIYILNNTGNKTQPDIKSWRNVLTLKHNNTEVYRKHTSVNVCMY